MGTDSLMVDLRSFRRRLPFPFSRPPLSDLQSRKKAEIILDITGALHYLSVSTVWFHSPDVVIFFNGSQLGDDCGRRHGSGGHPLWWI